MGTGSSKRLNQTLKYMISSKCFTENLKFSRISVYLEITYWYNQIIHSTTRFSPSQLMYGSNFENTVDRFYTNDEINSILNNNRLWTAEDIYIENREREIS
ncbi:hypothetical protein DMUE_4555 [Dictyocoela muelleri]|nr:hypothetical protein DMUE_4555 [Dictyocoela muelleri]